MRQEDRRWFLGLSRNVILLGLVSFFTDLSSQMIFPLLPLYLVSVLGAGGAVVGLVEGAAEGIASVLKGLSGRWSDRLARRKPFMLLGYGLSSFVKPLFALAWSWPLVLLIRLVERLGKGLRDASRDAVLAESVEESLKGRAFGFQRALDGLGSVLGALLAFWLLPLLGYRKLFLLAFVPAVAVILFLLPVKEPDSIQRESPGKKFDREPKRRFSSWPASLRWFLGVAAIFSLGHFGYAFLLLKAKETGLSDEFSILYYALFYAVYTLASMPAGVLSDKLGRKPVLLTGYALFAWVSLGLFFAKFPALVLAAFVVYGLFFALIDGVQRAYVSDLAPEHLQGTALGYFHMITGLTALPGIYLAGLLWDSLGSGSTFLYGFALSTLACLLLAWHPHFRRSK